MTHPHKTTAVRKKQIINATRKLIIKHGSEHITVREIARAVGISEGAIYRHFDSKKDILSLLADHIGDNLVGDIPRASTDGHSPLEVLDDVLRNQLSAIERGGASFQVIAEIISLGDKKLNKKMSDIINKYIGCLGVLLSRGIESGEVRQDTNVEAAATLLFGMIHALVNLWTLNNHSFELEEKYEPLWHTFREAVTEH